MTVLVVGRTRVASDFILACEYGGRDYVLVDPIAHPGLSIDEAAGLLDAEVRNHGVNAIVDGTTPFDGTEFAAATYAVAMGGQIPIIRARAHVFEEPNSDPPWIWVEDLVQASENLADIGVDKFVVDVGESGLEGAPRLRSLRGCLEWDAVLLAAREQNLLPSSVPERQAEALLQRDGVEAVVVADRGGARTHSLLRAALQLSLQVVAVRHRQFGSPGSAAGDPPEAVTALGIAQWLRTVDRQEPGSNTASQ